MSSNNKSKAIHTAVLFTAVCGLLATLGACAGNKGNNLSKASEPPPGTGLQDSRKHALYDFDSRNNENPSLGVKPRWLRQEAEENADRQYKLRGLEQPDEHAVSTFQFDRAVAERIEAMPEISAAYVLLTELNCYIAVVPEGYDPAKEAAPEVMKYKVRDNEDGVGIFGKDSSASELDWRRQPGLPYSLASAIRTEVRPALPSRISRIYVSSNPNFVERVRLYAQEGKRSGDLTRYLPEFNTLVQRVFPREAQ